MSVSIVRMLTDFLALPLPRIGGIPCERSRDCERAEVNEKKRVALLFFFLIYLIGNALQEMAPFNSALLNTTPTPEPEMRPTAPAKATAPSMEHEGTEIEKARRVWAALRERLDTQIKIIPEDDPALFEDRESWTRGWNDLHVELSNSAQTSSQLGITLELDDEGMKQLTEGKRVYRAFMKEIKGMKGKAIEEPGPSTPVRTRRALQKQKMIAEVVLPPAKDTGEMLVMRRDARMSVQKAPCCTRCNDSGVVCGGAPGKRCPPCAKAKQTCSFSRSRKVTRKAAARPKGESAPDAMEIGSSGSGESDAEGKEVSSNVPREVPDRVVKPLPSRAHRAARESAHIVRSDNADEPEGALERLRAENAHLKSIIRGMRNNARNQQSRLITFSNQMYAMSQEMSQLDSDLRYLD
ncbi:hypothetical protein BDR04DRAFT_1123263 [Suillus decipiens]|nr:hypothetical protein BDR04DRAFT_1123263 [Suillus decipiens]